MAGLIAFTIDCIPTAQARARHTRSGRAYKSASQLANERTLEAMLLPFRPAMPFDGALQLRFMAYMPIPLSAGKKRREAMLRGDIGHTTKPDLDNLAKQLMDAMTRLRFWNDDRQIVELMASKAYADKPCWRVEVQAAKAAILPATTGE